MYKLAEAARKVADGDFSVYVPTFHTSDKRDYLDVMILDFNKMVEELGSIETTDTNAVWHMCVSDGIFSLEKAN